LVGIWGETNAIAGKKYLVLCAQAQYTRANLNTLSDRTTLPQFQDQLCINEDFILEYTG
jgi:hypothetical protein